MNNKILGTIVAVGMIRSFAPSFSGEDRQKMGSCKEKICFCRQETVRLTAISVSERCSMRWIGKICRSSWAVVKRTDPCRTFTLLYVRMSFSSLMI